MKLLLTSEGITNKSIADALGELIEKPLSETRLMVITTGLNIEPKNGPRMIRQLTQLQDLGFCPMETLDFPSVPESNWKSRMEKADVIVFQGGNLFHLMYCIEKAGLGPLLREWAENKVYMGISAGSALFTNSFAVNNQEKRAYAEKVGEFIKEEGLGFVDFQVRAHYLSPEFPHSSEEHVEGLSKEVSGTFYAIDDNTAIKVIDNEVKIISEGMWEKFN